MLRGMLVGVGTGYSVTLGDIVGLEDGEGEVEGLGLTLGVGVGVGLGVGLRVGVGVGLAVSAWLAFDTGDCVLSGAEQADAKASAPSMPRNIPLTM
jgi:hypothetical protein